MAMRREAAVRSCSTPIATAGSGPRRPARRTASIRRSAARVRPSLKRQARTAALRRWRTHRAARVADDFAARGGVPAARSRATNSAPSAVMPTFIVGMAMTSRIFSRLLAKFAPSEFALAENRSDRGRGPRDSCLGTFNLSLSLIRIPTARRARMSNSSAERKRRA